MDDEIKIEEEVIDKGNGLVITLVVIGVVIVVLLILFLFLFKKDKYKVTLKIDDEIIKLKVNENGKLELPNVKIKEGYTFVYYVVDGEIFYENTIIKESMQLEAVYIPNNKDTVKVEYDLKNGEGVSSATYVTNGNIVLPMSPIKKGYVFDGWINSEGTAVNNGEKINKKNTLLTAVYKNSKVVSHNENYTCDNYNGECSINDKECSCNIRKNAMVKEYSCEVGEYDADTNECISKRDISPKCKNGTYNENAKGCRVVTTMVKKCSKGTIYNGECYIGEIEGFDRNKMSCSGYMPTDVNKCFTSKTDSMIVCPTGYKRDANANNCYKIEEATLCDEEFNVIEEDKKQICVKTSEAVAVYECAEEFELNEKVCIKKYKEKAIKIK